MIADKHLVLISKELLVKEHQVKAAADLMDEGATVPFIARYRKEVTSGLDEVQIIMIRDRIEQLRALDKRREAILKSLEEQGKLTDELKNAVETAQIMAKLEDIYLPYKPKRRTRGIIAREKGLEPLAIKIMKQEDFDLIKDAEACINEDKGVASVEDALSGARDIIAEIINENSFVRERLRRIFLEKSIVSSKRVKSKENEKDAAKFRDYFEWQEPIANIPGHRILAIRRGAENGFLTYHIQPEEDLATNYLENKYIKGTGAVAKQLEQAIKDSYKRLLSPSMETDARLETKKKADTEAIHVFAENLRELLLASPMGQKSTIALDPGLRTGCKLAVLDPQGVLLHNDTIYPLLPKNDAAAAEKKLRALVKKYKIEAIAVGNGTGGREATAFCNGIKFDTPVTIVMVNESGASIYSASEAAREEFPDFDLTVRGAVSIGRRLMDPLAELVKIDPKSIGVGQYQHDVDQKAIRKSLDDVVVSCVNAVGVEVNTASKQLLRYVSGLSTRLTENLVKHRNENGPFVSRTDLKVVPGMGLKTYEQAAGFLRISDSVNLLDRGAVHPESYGIVEQMAKDVGTTVECLIKDADLRSKINLDSYITDEVGLPTLNDIMDELVKPGRDPRKEFELFSFTDGINTVNILAVGLKLPGVITNVTNFGAFVDVGVHQDGLVHISQLSDHFISNPHHEVKVNQKVEVTVVEIDKERNRISLSMKKEPDFPDKSRNGVATPREGRKNTGDRGKVGKPASKKERESRKPEYSEDNPFYQHFKNKK